MFRKLCILALILLPTLSAQLRLSYLSRYEETTVASLPASGNWVGRIFIVTDGDASDLCGTGGSDKRTFCSWDGDSWEPFSAIAAGGGDVTSVNGLTGVVVLDPDDLDDSATTNKFVTAAHLTILGNTSGTNTGDQTTITGNAGTATALAANGANCTAGQGAGGVNASGAAEDCVDFITSAEAPVQSVNSATGTVVLDADDIDDTSTTNKFTDAAGLAVIAATSGTNTGDQTTITGNAGTATALAANGTNCSAGNYPLGVDASGNAESCTAASGSGDVTGPASSVDNTLPRFNGTGGKTLQTSGVVVDDSDNVTIPGTLSVGTGATEITIEEISALTNPGVAAKVNFGVDSDTDRLATYSNGGAQINYVGTGDNIATATALAANGANCSAGSAPLGVDASGAVESCTDYEEDLSNSAGLIAALSDETGSGAAVFGTAPTISNPVLSTNSYITLTEMSAPTSPAANDARLYAKDDGGTTKICMKDSAGTETCISSGGSSTQEHFYTWMGFRDGTTDYTGASSAGAAVPGGADGAVTTLMGAGGTYLMATSGWSFIDATEKQIYGSFPLPATWTGTVDFTIKALVTTTIVGTIEWELRYGCDPTEVWAFDMETEGTLTTDVWTPTKDVWENISWTGITPTNCAAGELLHWSLIRDADDGTNDTDTGTALVQSMTLRYETTP